MRADATPLLSIFEKKIRLEVPIFQRQYVWTREHQWEPLWEDISRKFEEYLTGRKDAPVHFLGAMVLDQKQTPTTHVEKRMVIDGQQRLTTFQIFLSAFRDFCSANGSDDLSKECDSFILNKGMMASPELEKYKVYPTQSDRKQFSDVVTSYSKISLEIIYPQVRRKYAKYPDSRPPMIEAYLFFYEMLEEFLIILDGREILAKDLSLNSRIEECFQALKNALFVAVIDLENGDDAQVIFETLNARGEPLLPADLLRNYIFLRASRSGYQQELLYDKYWKGFDEPFWREEFRQGRLFRPRSDIFLQHFLSSRQGVDIPIKHLFVEYKYWIEKKKPFENIEFEVEALSKQKDDFKKLIDPTEGDELSSLARFLIKFDVGTVYPLLLFLMSKKVPNWIEIQSILESYIVRRFICGLTTKPYNRIFLTLTKYLHENGPTADNIKKYFSELSGESSVWPSDTKFLESWMSSNVYQGNQNAKLVHIYTQLNSKHIKSKSEEIVIKSDLTIEHLMPQEWIPNWPLTDGSKGLNYTELSAVDWKGPNAEATLHRNNLVHTMGNLTILTQPLNSSISNSEWKVKLPEILNSSLLPINLQLQGKDVWDESAIRKRGDELFNHAKSIWPGP